MWHVYAGHPVLWFHRTPKKSDARGLIKSRFFIVLLGFCHLTEEELKMTGNVKRMEYHRSTGILLCFVYPPWVQEQVRADKRDKQAVYYQVSRFQGFIVVPDL